MNVDIVTENSIKMEIVAKINNFCEIKYFFVAIKAVSVCTKFYSKYVLTIIAKSAVSGSEQCVFRHKRQIIFRRVNTQ